MSVPEERFNLNRIRERLLQTPATAETQEGRRAAVAMILLGSTAAEELLFIRRAEYQNDPWSGDIAFPGGGIEAQDRDSRAAAERETFEEIGLCLPENSYLGALGSISGAYLPVNISAHVYQFSELPPLLLNDEVVETFSVPLALLLDPGRNREKRFEYRGNIRNHPVIDLNGYAERVLWGISYRLLQTFFQRLKS